MLENVLHSLAHYKAVPGANHVQWVAPASRCKHFFHGTFVLIVHHSCRKGCFSFGFCLGRIDVNEAQCVAQAQRIGKFSPLLYVAGVYQILLLGAGFLIGKVLSEGVRSLGKLFKDIVINVFLSIVSGAIVAQCRLRVRHITVYIGHGSGALGHDNAHHLVDITV